MFKIAAIIGTGGFIGSIARYFTAQIIHKHILTSFPIGTFIVNITGCFLIGLIYGLSEKGDILSAEWRMFLTVGFCGGFTTFSTFANENIMMLKDGEFFLTLIYTALSVVIGLLATYLGNLIVKLG
jgi:fluoride exporter